MMIDVCGVFLYVANHKAISQGLNSSFPIPRSTSNRNNQKSGNVRKMFLQITTPMRKTDFRFECNFSISLSAIRMN